MEIRRASSSDLETLSRLGAETFGQTYKAIGLHPPGVIDLYCRESFRVEKLGAEMNDGPEEKRSVFFLGLLDGQPVGYAKMEFGDPPECVEDRNSCQFSQAYVLDSHRGKGLGHGFFEARHALARDRGYTGLWLGVWDMNKKAISFHKRMGFREVGAVAWRFKHEDVDYEDTDLIFVREI